MPRYFFHFNDGHNSEFDHHGFELPDPHVAWSQATMALGEMIRDREGQLAGDKVWSMEVTDDSGPVFTLSLKVETFRSCSEKQPDDHQDDGQ